MQSQKPAASDMRVRSATTAAETRAPPPSSSKAAAAPTAVPVSPRGPSGGIQVAPRVVPPSINVANLPAAPGQLSPRGTPTVAQPTWERKAAARPASERRDHY